MHVHETFWQELGWLGRAANASVLWAWSLTIWELAHGEAQETWWLIALPIGTLIIAYTNWVDWRRVRRRRAVIRRIQKRQVTDDDLPFIR